MQGWKTNQNIKRIKKLMNKFFHKLFYCCAIKIRYQSFLLVMMMPMIAPIKMTGATRTNTHSKE